MEDTQQEAPNTYKARLEAEQAVRNATGTPIVVNRNGPQHEQNATLGQVRVVNTDQGKFTVTKDGKVEKGGRGL